MVILDILFLMNMLTLVTNFSKVLLILAYNS